MKLSKYMEKRPYIVCCICKNERKYIKEFVETYVGEEDEEGKSFTEERLLQLYIIPPHQSTGKIVAGKHRITFYIRPS